MNTVNVSELHVYPVKSLRGISVDKWPMTKQGLLHDRQWMLIMPNGRFVSQRQLPQMALIDVEINQTSLFFSKSGQGAIKLKLPSVGISYPIKANVWNDECEVIESHKEVSSWLNQVLKPPQPLKLVQMVQNQQRIPAEPERFGSKNRVLFADAAPFLITNKQSLIALNKQLENKGQSNIDNRHFRPNIVIDGLDAFQEHNVQSLSCIHQHYDLQLIDHCERCIITTINPDTGKKDSSLEPLQTLTEINPMPNKPKAAAFGVNAIIDIQKNLQTISVGDSLLFKA